jgi:hypothetical protein
MQHRAFAALELVAIDRVDLPVLQGREDIVPALEFNDFGQGKISAPKIDIGTGGDDTDLVVKVSQDLLGQAPLGIHRDDCPAVKHRVAPGDQRVC